MAILIGPNFVPSIAWIDQFGPIFKVASWLAAAIFFLALVEGNRYRSFPDLEDMTFTNFASLALGIPFLAMCFQATFFVSVPYAIKLASGAPAAMHVVVKDPRISNLQGCSKGIEITGRPFASLTGDRICGVPMDFSDTLHKGHKLVVFGRGSFAGIFPDSVETLESVSDLSGQRILEIDG